MIVSKQIVRAYIVQTFYIQTRPNLQMHVYVHEVILTWLADLDSFPLTSKDLS